MMNTDDIERLRLLLIDWKEQQVEATSSWRHASNTLVDVNEEIWRRSYDKTMPLR